MPIQKAELSSTTTTHHVAVIESLERELARLRLQGRSVCVVLGLNVDKEELVERYGSLGYHNIVLFRALCSQDPDQGEQQKEE